MSDSPHTAGPGPALRTTTEREAVSTEDIAELLNDAYALRILREIRAEAKPARDLADACDASRPTVYRRLNDLRDAGLVETAMQYHPDGHHREVFEAAVEELTLSLGRDGFSVEVRTGETALSPGVRTGETASSPSLFPDSRTDETSPPTERGAAD